MFKLNMSDKEAESKDYEVLPTGNYVVRITGITLEEVSKPGANFGKMFWKITLVVEDGEYKGNTIITTAMLFEGALYTIKQMCEAIHPEYIDGQAINLPTVENGMPDPTPWEGQVVDIKGTKLPAGSKRKNGDIREYDEFQIKWKAPKANANKSGIAGLPMPS